MVLSTPITSGDPGDGNYTIINNLSATGATTQPAVWHDPSRVFQVFDINGDHTGAPEISPGVSDGNPPVAPGTNGGYFVAVNASFGTDRVISIPISNLCGDTYYEFSAWFRNVCRYCASDSMGSGPYTGSPMLPNTNFRGPDSSGVNPNLTYEIDGVDFYSTANIPYTGKWVKKGFVYRTKPGQTSFTVTIRNNAPGGGGNDWAIDDVSVATCLPSLTMRPNYVPNYCLNSDVDLSVAVSTFFNNYTHYQWERSTDNGATWGPAPESPGVQTFNYINYGSDYRDTVELPPFIAAASMDGYRYRLRVATSLANLSLNNCAIYNTTDQIELNILTSCDVLDLQLKNLKAAVVNGKVQLYWEGKSDEASFQFVVERSTNGRTFVPIGTVDGRGSLLQTYQFLDGDGMKGLRYYRIRTATSAGALKFSETVAIQGIAVTYGLKVLATAKGSDIRFAIEAPQQETVLIDLIDATGRVVLQQRTAVAEGVNAMSFAGSHRLSSGAYVLRVQHSKGVLTQFLRY